jgi:hypothetical protein
MLARTTRVLCTAALALTSLVGLGTTDALAAGSCSITVPPRVTIAASQTTIRAYPGSDCAASGMSIASWDVSPSNYGDSFFFLAGTLNSSYSFYASLDRIGVLRAVPAGASTSGGYNDLWQNSPTYVVKYATWSYIASSRAGTAVYINTLVHQYSNSYNGMASGVGRVSYLQRYIGGTWQNMIARAGNSTGRWTVGFIQPKVYQYRIVTVETGTAWSASSASTFR